LCASTKRAKKTGSAEKPAAAEQAVRDALSKVDEQSKPYTNEPNLGAPRSNTDRATTPSTGP